MPQKTLTPDEVTNVFRRSILSLDHAIEVPDLTEYDRLFRSISNPSWESSGSSVENMKCDETTTIFRISWSYDLLNNSTISLEAVERNFDPVIQSIRSISAGASGIRVHFDSPHIKPSPFGQTIELMAQGTISG
jgi:hypothetical protein